MSTLYTFSKTCDLIYSCNNRSKMEQKTMGFFVLLTALFAFVSGYYAFTSIFGDWNPVTNQYDLPLKMQLLTVSVAFMYALMIGLIDREIVSASNKAAVLFRIPLALIVGVVVSVPLKIKVLEDSIHQKIYENRIEKNAPFVEKRNKTVSGIDMEIREIDTQIAYYVHLLNDAVKRAIDEDLGLRREGVTGVAGQGRFYRYAREEEANYRMEIERLERLRKEKLAFRERRLNELNQDLEYAHVESVFGLWEKYRVMHQITREDETGKAKMMVFGLTVLFVLFELIPSLIKLLNPKNDYDKLLELRGQLINERIRRAKEYFKDDFDFDQYLELPEIRNQPEVA